MPVLEQVLETYPKNVRVVELNFPLNNHKLARPAAAAALAAGKQGKFWELHAKLFENHKKLTDELIVELARDLGLEMARFEIDRKSQEINDLINRDLKQGRNHGVRGTPTVFVNGKRLPDRSLAAITQAIEHELARGQAGSSGRSPASARSGFPSILVNQPSGSSEECGG
jgi:protein-disulfide isomerase